MSNGDRSLSHILSKIHSDWNLVTYKFGRSGSTVFLNRFSIINRPVMFQDLGKILKGKIESVQ
jgi:hypothetical protein